MSIALSKGSIHMYMSYIDFKNIDFIEEHMNILIKNNYVWLGNLGKVASKVKVQQVIDNKGLLLLKGPKSKGNKIHVARIKEYLVGVQPECKCYPGYYNDFKDDFGDPAKMKCWLRLESITHVSKELVLDKMECISNDKPLKELMKTRATLSYLKTNSSFALEIIE